MPAFFYDKTNGREIVSLLLTLIHFNTMLKKTIGYILAITGGLCFIFFDKYEGHLIAYPRFWYIISIAVTLVGIYMISLPKLARALKERKEREAEPY